MKILNQVLICCCLIASAYADDTEIYGAAGVDPENRVNSNVLFIMDTSGSMGETVLITQKPYVNDPVIPYSGTYNTDEFYYENYHDPSDGIKLSEMQTSGTYDCSSTKDTLATTGKVLVSVQQKNKKGDWKSFLSRGKDRDVRCGKGSSEWLRSGKYMNYLTEPGNVTTSTRMQVTVDVVKELTGSLSNINLGLMRFDRDSDGGIIDVPVTDVATSGPLINAKVDSYYANGGTPLEESMHEAARYYRGDTWSYGNGANPNSSVSTSRTTADTSKYLSPITATCQKNHIILLTDGEPTGDVSSNATIQGLISGTDLTQAGNLNLNSSCAGNGQCMDELAYWLQNTDQSDTVVGDQPITTYTIGGFDLANGVDLLKRTATAGGGQYYEANDTAGLTDALESIFLDILAQDSTFTAPAVSVNAFNSSEHRDELFYALFRPSDSAKWAGNLKKYRLNPNGYVEGANGNPAISTATGFFNDSAKDYWNNTENDDGNNVLLGGSANLLEPSSRNVYTQDSANFLGSFSSFATAESLDMLTSSAEEVEQVKNWAIGMDVDDANGNDSITDSRYSIGDPLHSEPVVITYGGDDDNPDSTIYFGTNEGFVHAINAETGQEQFSFIPKELHKTQHVFYENQLSAGNRPYGMDGPITSWMYDLNNNNIIYNSSNNRESTNGVQEHIYLYAGMRRGGSSYYGLDVSDRSNPRMLFNISHSDVANSPYSYLGQTWSRMTPAKVKWGDGFKFVLFFSGGYDTNQDSNTYKENDTVGNAIYMVDATSGNLLWWAGKKGSGANLEIEDMVNSIPASLSVVDISGNGYVDMLFAVDTGGRIFRIDITKDPSDNNDFSDDRVLVADNANLYPNEFAKGGVIASLSVDGTSEAAKQGNRRFYSKPSIGLIKDNQIGDYLTIAVGSGHRAHPISTTEVKNRFYVIRDDSPYTAPDKYEVATEASESKTTLAENEEPDSNKVYNATSIMNDPDDFDLRADLAKLINGGSGWYVTFGTEGEKVITQAITFSGSVFFNTFSPTSDLDDDDTASCGADTGQSRFYALDMKFPLPSLDLEDGASQKLANSGIAPRPVVIYRKGGGKSIAIGTETIDDARFNEGSSAAACPAGEVCKETKCEAGNCYVTPVYWRQNDNN